MRLKCPHCGHPAHIRTTEPITNLLVKHYFTCTNHMCGHTFVGATEITYTLSPSATPNPDVLLPLSQHVRRGVLTRQLQVAGEAVADPFPPPGEPSPGQSLNGTTPAQPPGPAPADQPAVA